MAPRDDVDESPVVEKLSHQRVVLSQNSHPNIKGSIEGFIRLRMSLAPLVE